MNDPQHTTHEPEVHDEPRSVQDVADHLALGERLAIESTPTVLVLDATGRVRRRAAGVPTLAQVRAALAEAGAPPTA